MKRSILAASVAFLAGASSAHAGPLLFCWMKDSRQNQIYYAFAKQPGLDHQVGEFNYMLNGHETRSNPDNMPVWATGWNDKVFFLTSTANPDYTLVSAKLGPMAADGYRHAAAAVFHKGVKAPVSVGQCSTLGASWKADAPSYSAPVAAATRAPTYTVETPAVPAAPFVPSTAMPSSGTADDLGAAFDAN